MRMVDNVIQLHPEEESSYAMMCQCEDEEGDVCGSIHWEVIVDAIEEGSTRMEVIGYRCAYCGDEIAIMK